ncbi:GntR family transcriptional regulator, partial [Micromonospora sp. NPDC052213]|uniref:GntR family transcriptional regulator n=1 Tax=Micromonospora sp. NPDC052213 TaxID=3155812 RepID=UPI0034425C1F
MSRSWLAASTIRVASQSTRCWISSRRSRSVRFTFGSRGPARHRWVREALTRLERDGLVNRRQGDGTYVAEPRVEH